MGFQNFSDILVRSQSPLKYALQFYIIITCPTTTQQKPGLNDEVIFDVVLLVTLHPLDRSGDHEMSLPPKLFRILWPVLLPSPYSQQSLGQFYAKFLFQTPN